MIVLRSDKKVFDEKIKEKEEKEKGNYGNFKKVYRYYVSKYKYIIG